MPTGGIWESKCSDVGVGRGLGVVTTRDHSGGGRDLGGYLFGEGWHDLDGMLLLLDVEMDQLMHSC